MKPATTILLFAMGVAAGPLSKAAVNVLTARDNIAISSFSLTLTDQLNAFGCTFDIGFSDGSSDSVTIDCQSAFDGATINSPDLDIQYSLSCNPNTITSSGLTECGVLRHVCVTEPVVGKGCVTIDLGSPRGAQCAKRRMLLLKGRQDPPEQCTKSQGTNLPQTIPFA